MNYKKIHDLIIDKAKNRIKPDCYCEKHHILPKSLGGNNAKSNLVWLTAKEHYLIHWLLFKIYKNREMAFAWYRMTHTKNSTNRYTSYSFEYAKKKRLELVSGSNNYFYGKKFTEEHREKLRKSKLGKSYKDLGRNESPLKNKKLSADHIEKIRKKSIGRKHTEESKKKMKEYQQKIKELKIERG